MHTEKREDPLVEMGYEVRDINLKGITKAVIIFFAFAAAMIAISWVVLFGIKIGPINMIGMNPMYANKQSGYNKMRVIPTAPNPVLQTNVSARTDIADMRQNEAKRLNNYSGPQDAQAHIPINAAIEKLVERGISTGASVPAVSKGTTQPDMNVSFTESQEAALSRMKAAEDAAVEKFGPAGKTSTPAPGDGAAH